MTNGDEHDNLERPSRMLGRRQLLAYGSGAMLGALLTPREWRMEGAWAATAAPQAAPGGRPVPSLTTVLRRREDFLRLRYDFYNLKLDTTAPTPRLVRLDSSADAYVVVTFPAQATAEEAGYEYDPKTQPDPSDNEDPGAPPIGARLGGESRLAYLLPADVTEIQYSVEGLLAWNTWTPRVVPVALTPGPHNFRPGSTPKLRAPGPLETALELPWWLIVSPHAKAAWAHGAWPVTHEGVTELWHTRLGVQAPGGVDEADPDLRTVRAVWNLDPGFKDWLKREGADPQPSDGEGFPAPSGMGLPFRMSLSPRDRYDLVVSTSDWQHQIATPAYVPQAANVNRLMLSGLGGWLDVEGSWIAAPHPAGSGTSLESWRHLATLGRDHYVRVVRRGYCYPFRHGAALIKVTERKFKDLTGGRRVAYLFQRYFLVVRQRQVFYGGPGHDNDGRAFPFSTVRVTTVITPNLDPPNGTTGLGATLAFVPTAGGKPVPFHMVGTDWAGHSVDFDTPILFVDGTIADDDTKMATLTKWYEDPAKKAPRTADFRVVLADFVQLAPGRSATVVFGPSAPAVTITVTGPAPTSTEVAGSGKKANPCHVIVEQRHASVTDMDLGWTPVGGPVTLPATVSDGEATWSGSVPLPVAPGQGLVRLVIEQSELLALEEESQNADPFQPGVTKRIVYSDLIVV